MSKMTVVTLEVLLEKTVKGDLIERIWVLALRFSFSWCFISNSEYFYKTSYILNGSKLVWFAFGLYVRSVTETLVRQADCRLRNVQCDWVVCSSGGVHPSAFTWISNIKWNGCSIPLEIKTLQSVVFLHLRFFQSTYFLFLLGLSMRILRIFFL